MKIKEDFVCPKCKHKNRMKLYTEISGTEIKKIIDKEIFLQECKKCHEKVMTEYPLTVKGEYYTIYFTPSSNEPIDEAPSSINRICDTFADLKEKVLILEDELNDIVVEELKNQIKKNLSNLDIDNIDSLDRIRYNSKDSSYLNFSLVGVGALVGISIGEYQELLRKVHIKKIKKSVLIDEYTYKKYMRKCRYEIAGKKRISFFKW